MDNQGANVCMTNRTSDYWQGDEAKWQKSFEGGKGAIFIDERKYDSSAKAVIVQISVPVMDGDKAIGAITVGIKVD
jgi:sensor histidine kinase regulating citrate/malate metabolism